MWNKFSVNNKEQNDVNDNRFSSVSMVDFDKLFFCWVVTGNYWNKKKWVPQSASTCSKLTVETLEQGGKYVQSSQ